MHLRNLKSVASSQRQPRGRDHAPFGWKCFNLGGALAVVDPLAKFKECIFIRSGNIDGGLKLTQAAPLSIGNFYSWDGTCRSRSTCQIFKRCSFIHSACSDGAIGSVAVRAAWLRRSASLGWRPRLVGSLYQVLAVYALRLNSRAGTWGSTVSSLICNRWLMLGLETLSISRCLNH